MSAILVVVVVILVEKLTQKNVLEIVTWLFSKVWAAIEWVILLLAGMNEPRGGRT